MRDQDGLYFATSGIRGKSNLEISPELALRVGRAVANWLINNKNSSHNVYVGFDNRRNSISIANVIIAALTSSGINVTTFSDPIPTPLLIFSILNSKSDAGIMVTGSHLPKDDNGIILFDETGNYFKGILEEPPSSIVPWSELGVVNYNQEMIKNYKNHIANYIQSKKLSPLSWSVVVDTAHGPMGLYFLDVITKLYSNFKSINYEMDDTFPGRLSEPTPKNLIDTNRFLQINNLDLGIATDMDGDRVIFITDKGEILTGDYIGAVLAINFWKKHPSQTIVVPINTSAIINIIADEMGGKIEYCKVGPPSIVNKMREINSLFGFEETGKYFFGKDHVYPDSLISVIELTSFLFEKNKKLSSIVSEMPKLYSLKTKINCDRKNSKNVMNDIKNSISNYFNDKFELITMDGLRINFSDNSWLLIRPSGTEDYIRVFSEHNNKDKNEKLNQLGQKIVTDHISS